MGTFISTKQPDAWHKQFKFLEKKRGFLKRMVYFRQHKNHTQLGRIMDTHTLLCLSASPLLFWVGVMGPGLFTVMSFLWNYIALDSPLIYKVYFLPTHVIKFFSSSFSENSISLHPESLFFAVGGVSSIFETFFISQLLCINTLLQHLWWNMSPKYPVWAESGMVLIICLTIKKPCTFRYFAF